MIHFSLVLDSLLMIPNKYIDSESRCIGTARNVASSNWVRIANASSNRLANAITSADKKEIALLVSKKQ